MHQCVLQTYKLTQFSSSHPSHVKNSIPFSQFVRLCRRCSDDSGFFHKSESMCQFFDKHGNPVSVIQAGHHCMQLIDRSHHYKRHKKNNPFPLTFHPHNHSVKTIILKNFKLLQNDPETGTFCNLHSFHSNATKTQAIFWSEVHSKLMTNPALLHAFAHDARLVLLFKTSTKYRDLSDPLRSLITSHAPPPTLSIA